MDLLPAGNKFSIRCGCSKNNARVPETSPLCSFTADKAWMRSVVALCLLSAREDDYRPVSRGALQIYDFLWRMVKPQHHLMPSAVMRTQVGIPPLSAHLLNLPSSGRRVRVYLSLLQWSAWPSSVPRSHTQWEDPIHSHPHRVGSENLCALQHGLFSTSPHSPKSATCSHRQPFSSFCPSVQRDSGVEGWGWGFQMFLCWSYQSAPSLFIVSTLWQTNTLTCPGS